MKQKILWVACCLLLMISIGEGIALVHLYRKVYGEKRGDLNWAGRLQNLAESEQNDMELFDEDALLKELSDGEPLLVAAAPKRQETKDEIQLAFSTQGHEENEFSVDVNDELITLKREEKKTQAGHERGWSFTQSFSIPSDANSKKFRIERQKNQLVVIFKKKS
jgi:hypothetical protein